MSLIIAALLLAVISVMPESILVTLPKLQQKRHVKRLVSATPPLSEQKKVNNRWAYY